MKKYLSLILAVLMLISFTACTQQAPSSEQDSIVSAYKEKAEEFIANGDYDSAIAVLEEGISATNSEELIKMLEDTQKAKEEAEASIPEGTGGSTFDLSKYFGWWAETEDVYSNGGLKIDLRDCGKYWDLTIEFNMTDRPPASSRLVVLAEDIKSNKLRVGFIDDYVNYGTAELEFLEDKIICTIFDLEPTYFDDVFYEGEYVLTCHGTEQ